ncbi:MAG: ATP-binding protein [candidate division WOR-3 bacterium]
MKGLSAEFYKEILDLTVDGVAIVEGDKIVFHNRRLEEMTGYDDSELLNIDFTRLFSEGSLSVLNSALNELKIATFPLHLEVNLLTKTNRELACEVWVCPWKKDKGKLIFYFRDITFWKEMEKGQAEILGKISHEILSPLTTIKEAINILKEKAVDKLEENLFRFLDLASEEVVRLERIAGNLIDMTRITRGKLYPIPKEISIKELVEKAINSLQLFIQKKRINVIKEIPNDLPSLCVDPDQLSSVLINLLDNAVKFSEEGKEVIIKATLVGKEDEVVRERKVGPADKYLMVSVRDFGPGIEEENREKIFEMFERGALAEVSKGIGLGLAIVKEFIHLHKGEIWVESKKGSGSTFHFLIPLVKPCRKKDGH